MTHRARFVARYGPWAVVTGASSGIGAEFARQLAARGLSLVLVARRRDRLEELGAELFARHGTDVRIVTCDLSDARGPWHLLDEVADVDVGLLINNAGVGLKGRLVDLEPEILRRLVEVNCQAPLALSHGFGRRLVARRRGGMVIVASTGGFQGLPWSAAYGASKGFDLLLGEALAVELAADGIDVLTLAPGGTDTEGPMNSGVDPARVPVRLMSVGPVVRAALDSLGRRTLVIPGAGNRAAAWAVRLVPRAFAARAAGRLMRRVIS
ncbi:MAG: SDR family NAD(P)-dependent oxidoreductase [Kofleriaceae bacterium]|nr:MAG: SDR family NAD(P)-dependent oxidoreductase [Kofleriaceae bacterium]MBZ0238927.1 SDR family NAD(P)-dependent oxidoreductase [Kofleriaceae bacterium]